MSFRELYDFCQEQDGPYISRRVILPKAQSLSGKTVQHMKSGKIKAPDCRGYFISADRADHPLILQSGGRRDIIVTSRDNNRCWERFVFVKELMHLFDDPLEKAGTPEEFESIISDFITPPSERSIVMSSEIKALWMALSLFCPEEKRIALNQSRMDGTMTDREIALLLKIPEQNIPPLFSAGYKPTVATLLGV